MDHNTLKTTLETVCPDLCDEIIIEHGELTVVVLRENLLALCRRLQSETSLQFDMLMDVAGVDYLDYGRAEWETTRASQTGFDRAVEPVQVHVWQRARFGVAYHLLSISHRHRIRLKVF